MAVQGFHTVSMANHHGIAVTAFPTFENHFTVGSGLNRRTGRRSIVDTGVHTDGMQDWVDTVAERGRNARVRNRLGIKAFFLLQGLTVLVVVATAFFVAFALAVIIGLVGFAVFNHFSRQNIADRHLLAAEIHAVVQKTHGIAFAQVAHIERIGKDFFELDIHFGRDFGTEHITDGGSADFHGTQGRHGFHVDFGIGDAPFAFDFFQSDQVAFQFFIGKELNVGHLA